VSGARVSVCVPVRNGELFLGSTLASVLSQDIEGLEVVVADNASTDRTLELLRDCRDPRLRVLAGGEDIGGIPNWNRVASAAQGEFVKLLAADDLLYPGALQAQVDVLQERDNARVVLVVGQRDVVDEQGRVLVRARGLGRLSGRVPGGEAVRASVRAGTNLFGEPHVALFRRASMPPGGAFRPEASYMVDLDLWCRLLAHGDLYALRSTVGAFRVHAGAESVRIAAQQAAQAAGLFRDLREEGRVGRSDVVLGAARARLLAVARRGVYAGLRARHAVHRARPSTTHGGSCAGRAST
jgi:glycosyltransferase involved in cell wall biosynthesis